MAINALLCRWGDGWREVTHPDSIAAIGRREALLSLGALADIPEVDRVARLQLGVVAFPRTAIAADLAPMGLLDRPYRAFNVGDTIGCPDYGTGTISQRVRALTGAEDDDGEITYSPELGDLILEEQERTLQSVKKMADGTLEGESPVAQPRLRAQIQRIWAPPSMPPSGGPGMRVVANRHPHADYSSANLRTVPSGDGDYTLVTFRATPEGEGFIDGPYPQIELWQHVPGGDGNSEAARVELGFGHNPDVTYEGTIFDASITFGPENGMSFRSNGGFSGPVHVEALFSDGSGTFTISWDAPERALTVGARR